MVAVPEKRLVKTIFKATREPARKKSKPGAEAGRQKKDNKTKTKDLTAKCQGPLNNYKTFLGFTQQSTEWQSHLCLETAVYLPLSNNTLGFEATFMNSSHSSSHPCVSKCM